MSLRFFADQCVSNYIIQTLRDSGHEVFRLRDHIPPDSEDRLVLTKAQELDAILISLNGDFADIVTYPPVQYKGILSLQIRNHPEIMPGLMSRLTRYLLDHPHKDHYKGKLFLVDAHRIRVRE